MGENYIASINSIIVLSNEKITSVSSNVYKISIQTSIDFDIINGVLYARSKREGDSYIFGGMTRKLKKLFNDKKIPIEKRCRIPVICDDLGILWVKGFATRDGGDKNSKNRLYIAIAEEMA